MKDKKIVLKFVEKNDKGSFAVVSKKYMIESGRRTGKFLKGMK